MVSAEGIELEVLEGRERALASGGLGVPNGPPGFAGRGESRLPKSRAFFARDLSVVSLRDQKAVFSGP